LHGQLGQQLDSLPVVANRERLEAEHRLQLDQVLASGLLTLPVLVPAFDADLELVGDQSQQWRERWLISAKDDAGKAQVAELHREAQPIGRAAPLPDDGEVGVRLENGKYPTLSLFFVQITSWVYGDS